MSKIFNRDIELAGSAKITKGGSTIISATGKVEAPLQFTAADAIYDGNGNEILDFSQTASAINHFVISNAAQSGAPTLSVAGDDPGIGIIIKATQAGVTLKTDSSTAAVFASSIGGVFAPFMTYTVPISNGTAGDVTFGATQILGGLITRTSTGGSNRTDTLPSATQLIAAASSQVAVGSTINFTYRNAGTNSVTIGAGGGGSISGSAVILGASGMRAAIVFSNVSSGTEAYTMYNLGFSQ